MIAVTTVVLLLLICLLMVVTLTQPVHPRQYRDLQDSEGVIVESSDDHPHGPARGWFVRIRLPGDRFGRLVYIAEYQLYRRLEVGKFVRIRVGSHPSLPGRWLVEIREQLPGQ